jgi:PIN domain nuclease of toxin-antitoxin system
MVKRNESAARHLRVSLDCQKRCELVRTCAGSLPLRRQCGVPQFCVSAWEISVKWSMGKLALPYPPPQFIPRERKRHFINKLPFTEKDTFHLAILPTLHKDQFDRILVCQAIKNGLTILTADQHIRQYPVQTLW